MVHMVNHLLWYWGKVGVFTMVCSPSDSDICRCLWSRTDSFPLVTSFDD